MRQQLHMAWFIFYIMKKYFQVYFFKNHNIYFLDAYFSFLKSFFLMFLFLLDSMVIDKSRFSGLNLIKNSLFLTVP